VSENFVQAVVLLQGLAACLVSSCSKIRSGRSGSGEVTGEHWLKERAEYDLRTTSCRKSHPEHEDEFEGIVEWKPVYSVYSTLEDGEEGIDNPISQPLSIIRLARTEECLERVVARNDKAGSIDEELSSDVEEDEEEIDSDEAEEGIDLGHAGLLLEVVEQRILGQLLVDLVDLVLGFILEGRHFYSLSRIC